MPDERGDGSARWRKGQREAVGVRIAGRGGQGVMLSGYLLALAGMADALHVVQTQSYGPEARLGAAKSDVILSRDEVAYPEVSSPDIFLCLSQDAYSAYGTGVSESSLSILDSRVEGAPGAGSAIVVPLAATARDGGAPFATNIVGLGVLVAITALTSERSIREALTARIKPDSLPANLRAFDAGLALGAKAAADQLAGNGRPVFGRLRAG